MNSSKAKGQIEKYIDGHYLSNFFFRENSSVYVCNELELSPEGFVAHVLPVKIAGIMVGLQDEPCSGHLRICL